MGEPVKTIPELDARPEPEPRSIPPEVVDQKVRDIIARYPLVMAKLAE